MVGAIVVTTTDEDIRVSKIYHGQRTPQGTDVTVDGKPLDPRVDLRAMSKVGFEWGYSGAGPMQLALAILADHHVDNDGVALRDFKRYCELVIAEIDRDEWTIDSARIDGSLNEVTDVPLTLEQLMSRVKGRN
jgi:hypothetical protein